MGLTIMTVRLWEAKSAILKIYIFTREDMTN